MQQMEEVFNEETCIATSRLLSGDTGLDVMPRYAPLDNFWPSSSQPVRDLKESRSLRLHRQDILQGAKALLFVHRAFSRKKK